MKVTRPWVPLCTVFAVLAQVLTGCGSSPAAAHGNGGMLGSGGASPVGGATALAGGGASGAAGLSSAGRSGSGGLSAGGVMGRGGAAGAADAGPSPAGGGSGAGGATDVRDGGPAGADASSDVASATGGARNGSGGGAGASAAAGTGGAAGSRSTGGATTGRDGGAATGGSPGSGGASASGGSPTGGGTGTPAACASNEVSTCTRGDGPLGAELKCDFGGNEGNYDVTVELGGTAAGDTFVDAEMYRRMVPELATLAGQAQRFNFTVNVRTPEGQPVQVGSTDGVPGLQVYFRGSAPQVSVICHRTASKPLMLWIGGDSTVCDQDSSNYTGWGQRLPQLMQGAVSIANYADSGESSGSFLNSSAMFGAIKSRWKSGDWFFLQMGHNDKTTSAADFQSNMTSYVTQAKAAGVNIVLITPISRVGYTLAEEHVNSTGANLPQIIRTLGTSQNVPVIDLTVTTWDWIGTITPKDYFAADSSVSGGYDHTHLGPKGGDVVAGFVRDAIKSKPGIPALLPFLR